MIFADISFFYFLFSPANHFSPYLSVSDIRSNNLLYFILCIFLIDFFYFINLCTYYLMFHVGGKYNHNLIWCLEETLKHRIPAVFWHNIYYLLFFLCFLWVACSYGCILGKINCGISCFRHQNETQVWKVSHHTDIKNFLKNKNWNEKYVKP